MGAFGAEWVILASRLTTKKTERRRGEAKGEERQATKAQLNLNDTPRVSPRPVGPATTP
jgi:hypothetical protein